MGRVTPVSPTHLTTEGDILEAAPVEGLATLYAALETKVPAHV